MDEKMRKCCPNCSQLYCLKLEQTASVKGNLPLFLACGHSMCEQCIRNIVKFAEPIECKTCHKDMEIEPSLIPELGKDNDKLYNIFPVNLLMVGELAVQQLQNNSKQTTEDKEFFVDVHAILKEGDSSTVVCAECQKPNSKICQQCATYLCESCFNKSHKNFVFFKNHVLKDVDEVVPQPTCEIHEDKPLHYFCNDCKKSICMDCLMVGGDKSCKSHNVVSMQEVNDGFLEELSNITPKVDETFRRLTKTAYEVGHLLNNAENDTGTVSELTQIISNIEQHFSKLSSIVQKHKHEVVNIVVTLKDAEKSSLYNAKDELTDLIRKAKKVMDSIRMTSNPKKIKQMNLAILLEDAIQVAEAPWYLTKDDTKKETLKVAVNEDLCGLLSDYIHLEGNVNPAYKLRAAAELAPDVVVPPPPPGPVFAPVIPRDVRQKAKNQKVKEESQGAPMFLKKAPQYRSKSGSVSSLNSCGSDSSQKNYIQPHDGQHRPNVQPVQPFAESQHPKQLQEGSQELIYISHIVNPHNFYVQRTCQQSLVKELVHQFKNATSLPKPSLNHITEGKMYLAFNKADNMWQRCRVVSVNRNNPEQPLFQVFCFDFGSTEIVNVDKLRLIPPAKSHTPMPLAINCSLANCVPRTGAWSSDDSILIHKIIDNKQAVIHVRGVHSTPGYGVTLDCDVTTFEDGVSLAHALVFHERAKITNPKLKYPRISAIREKPKIFTSNNDFNYKTVEEVYITHIVSPDKFYVRKKHQQSVYEELCSDLEYQYKRAGNAGTIYLPEIGMSCCVHVGTPEGSAGGEWARALVVGLPGRGRAALELVDSGAPHLAHWTTLRHLHHKFARLTALATECRLAGVTPVQGRWSERAVLLLQHYSTQPLELRVEDTQRGGLAVTLLAHHPDGDSVCLNQEMVTHKYAITIGMYSFNKIDGKDEHIHTKRSPLDKQVQRSKPKPEVQILKRNQPNEVKINPADLEAKDKGPLRLEVKLLQYQTPSLLYISLVHQEKTFNELFEDMQTYYSENKPQRKSTWEVGDKCSTVCIKSQTWRRAVITSIEGENAKVSYTDFAFVETVPLSALVELPPEFAAIGDAAIKCHFSGIVPGVGEEWPLITKEYLQRKLNFYKRLFITKIGDFKNKSMPVEVWVYHTIPGGALEPNRSEWRCLNHKVIAKGLALPDKSGQAAAVSEPKSDGEDETLSFLNVRGSIHDWLQLDPPAPRAPRPAPADDEDAPDPASDVLFISDWLPPEPLDNKEFTAMPTYIDNDGVIYLHDVSQQPTLELIRKALDVRFKNPDPKAKYQKWVVGEPCVALYFLDNRYYRGRVLEVDNDTSTCLIHYIDYGNDEKCSFINLRKNIALHQIPTQAHKCVLNRIRPKDNQWDRNTLDYIHKSIVEKECLVKVTGETVDHVTPIDLKYDKLWINDHLVEFELATYVDGSKAVVRKFAPAQRKVVPPSEKKIDSDPDPDYIVESNSHDSSLVMYKDWNEMMEESDKDSVEDKFVSYPIVLEDEFKCNITVIHDPNTQELDIVHDDSTTLTYEEMFKDLQEEGGNQPPINGIFENKACIALFQQDQQWYRASILQFSEAKAKVKVRYVDYGNIEVVALENVREIHPDWVKLTPASVTVKLHGVKLNPEIALNVVAEEYKDTFLDKGPFIAKVFEKTDSYPIVELYDETNQLVYQNLIEKNIFLKCESD